jgi:hypothetical protein
MTKRFSIFTAFALILTVGAFAKDKGPISTTISAPMDAVKAAAVTRALKAGFLLDTEGQFQLVFARNMSGGQQVLVQTLASPSACSDIHPRHIITLAVAPGDQLTVVAQYEYEHAGPFCRSVREPITDGKVRSQLEKFLADIKADAEAPKTAPTTK